MDLVFSFVLHMYRQFMVYYVWPREPIVCTVSTAHWPFHCQVSYCVSCCALERHAAAHSLSPFPLCFLSSFEFKSFIRPMGKHLDLMCHRYHKKYDSGWKMELIVQRIKALDSFKSRSTCLEPWNLCPLQRSIVRDGPGVIYRVGDAVSFFAVRPPALTSHRCRSLERVGGRTAL